MNHLSSLLRRVGSVAALATIFAAVAATPGCGAADDPAPGDATASEADPVLAEPCGVLPIGTYKEPYYDVSAARCAMQTTTPLWAGRAFQTSGTDAKAAFERRLAAHGCTTAVSGGEPVSRFQKDGHYSITLCPDDCATWEAVADYAKVEPVYSRMTRTTPTGCLVNQAGKAPAGKIYVIWDPLCPGACRLQLDPYAPWG